MNTQFAITVVLFAAFFWYLLPMALRRISERRLAAACRRSRSIVLSIDDGPSEVLSLEILKTLQRNEIRASLFLLGRNAHANPSQARACARAGHEIGSHTFDHANGWKSSPVRWAQDFARGRREVRGILEDDTRLFRPPYGKLSLAGLIQAFVCRTRLCWWTIDTQDTRQRLSADEVLRRIDQEGGGVVLLHDLDRGEDKNGKQSHREYVIDLIDKIAAFSRENGYRIVTFGDLDLG